MCCLGYDVLVQDSYQFLVPAHVSVAGCLGYDVLAKSG
jgi:quinol monooxygenase YgiN